MKGYYQKIIDNAEIGTTHVCLGLCKQTIEMSNPYVTFCYRKTDNEWYSKKGGQKYWSMLKSEPNVMLISLDSIIILANQFPESDITGIVSELIKKVK